MVESSHVPLSCPSLLSWWWRLGFVWSGFLHPCAWSFVQTWLNRVRHSREKVKCKELPINGSLKGTVCLYALWQVIDDSSPRSFHWKVENLTPNSQGHGEEDMKLNWTVVSVAEFQAVSATSLSPPSISVMVVEPRSWDPCCQHLS